MLHVDHIFQSWIFGCVFSIWKAFGLIFRICWIPRFWENQVLLKPLNSSPQQLVLKVSAMGFSSESINSRSNLSWALWLFLHKWLWSVEQRPQLMLQICSHQKFLILWKKRRPCIISSKCSDGHLFSKGGLSKSFLKRFSSVTSQFLSSPHQTDWKWWLLTILRASWGSSGLEDGLVLAQITSQKW